MRSALQHAYILYLLFLWKKICSSVFLINFSFQMPFSSHLHIFCNILIQCTIFQFFDFRHLPERRANRPVVAMLPFGAGPRNCLGMRFAYMEMKFALVRMLKRWNIETCDKTQNPLPIKKNFSYSPLKGVWIKLVERNRWTVFFSKKVSQKFHMSNANIKGPIHTNRQGR